MSLLLAAFSADSVVVHSEDQSGVYDAGTFVPTAHGRIKNHLVTPEIIFGAIGRNVAADCLKAFVKEFAAVGFEQLTQIIPHMASTLVKCAGDNAALALVLGGWDADRGKMRLVCWQLRGEACEVMEMDAVQGGYQVQIFGPPTAQALARHIIAESKQGVPESFPEVFAKVADAMPEVGRGVIANRVVRPTADVAPQQTVKLREESTLGNGAGTKVSWVSITGYKPDGSSIVIPASTDPSQIATVPTPTLSTVVGGSKGARTYFVRMAYYIDGGVRGFSSETSISIPANSLLKVTSPANTPPWQGYGIFISTTTNLETWSSTVSEGGVNIGIPFGTDWTEPTAAIAAHGPQYATMLSHGIDGDMHAAAPYNLGLFFYPWFEPKTGLVRFYADANFGSGMVPGTASTPENVRGMYLDEHFALAAAGIKFTTITVAQGGAGTTTGVANTGGCPITGTTIVPLGVSALSHKAPNSRWVEIELEDGRVLTATPDHPVYTDKGKTPLRRVKVGQEVVTDCGMVAVIRKEKKTLEAEKEVISMTKGHLYHANGILSHNVKLPAS